MFDLPGPLGTFANFLVIALGFGLIIFIHELGHFLAAKWAGIRVLAFSIGFGQVLVSYRKGVGLRRGSSEAEYRKALYEHEGAAGAKAIGISPTEYRLSMLPLGGYVKMLGQEDLNPDATSDEPDSYQNCPVPKRMVVISAGVVMNMISAAVLFIIVFMAGLRVFPAQVGYVAPGSPAENAVAIARPEISGGLKRGDRIVWINGQRMHSYEAILPEIAMSASSRPAVVTVRRPGVEDLIEFEATPVKNEASGLLDLGIDPPISATLKQVGDPKTRRLWGMFSTEFGFSGLEPGDRFVSAAGVPVHSPFDLLDLARDSGGKPIQTTIRRGEETFEHVLTPVAELEHDLVEAGDGDQGIEHILGLTGVMAVNPHASEQDTQQGLKPGDIFARIGNAEYPSLAQGISIVQARAGKELDLIVLRKNGSGDLDRVKLSVRVTPEGTIGFYPFATTGQSTLVAAPPMIVPPQQVDQQADQQAPQQSVTNGDKNAAGGEKPRPVATPAQSLVEYPGSRIVSIDARPVSTLRDVPAALVEATREAYERGDESMSVSVELMLPLPVQPDGSIPHATTSWTLSRADIGRVRALGYTLAGGTNIVDLFQYEQIVDKARGPFDAIKRGIGESRRVMLQTYLTFLRLFEGSVKVQHLKGPVGIAHLGTQIASQGWVWVLFFMALISINLAVINFLPLPIVDGGQFLMLLYEGIRGRPVPVIVQNVTTMAGLVLIGSIFLFVTFNDVKAIFGV